MEELTYNNKPVLDACCGSKMFWFNKHDERAVFCDRREVPYHEFYKNQYIEIAPDFLCDFRRLPFADESFWHIIFDPPHVQGLSSKSWTALKYGSLDATWQDMLHDGFLECWRVLKPHGTLIFKWSEVQIKLAELLKVIPKKPLYGNRSGKYMTTHWLAFIKEGDEGNV